MQDEKKYSDSDVFRAVKNLAKLAADNSANSVYAVLSRAFNDDTITKDLLQKALSIPEDRQAEFDSIYKELVPGDRAIFLQATHLEDLENLKACLSEFRRAEYGASVLYESAKAAEPEFFFPRLFCVEVISTAVRNNRRVYACRLVNDDGSHADIPMYCPEENMFVSEADVRDVQRIYLDNKTKSLDWLKEIGEAKISELRDIINRLQTSINSDAQDAFKSVKAYGLHDESA
jgi:hypothetical protein